MWQCFQIEMCTWEIPVQVTQFARTESEERIFYCLRGVEAVGIFLFLSPCEALLGYMKPHLFLAFAEASGVGGTEGFPARCLLFTFTY